MAATFRALLATKEGDRQSVAVTELMEADLMAAMLPWRSSTPQSTIRMASR